MNSTICLTTTLLILRCSGWRWEESRIHDPDTIAAREESSTHRRSSKELWIPRGVAKWRSLGASDGKFQQNSEADWSLSLSISVAFPNPISLDSPRKLICIFLVSGCFVEFCFLCTGRVRVRVRVAYRRNTDGHMKVCRGGGYTEWGARVWDYSVVVGQY